MPATQGNGNDSKNYNRQNKLFWGTFVKAIGRDNCYEVVKSETGSDSWKSLTESQRDRVLNALSKKASIKLEAPKQYQKRESKPAASGKVLSFPNAQKTPSESSDTDRLSDEQSFTIEKLRKELGWKEISLDKFSRERFDKPVAWLDSRSAHVLIYLLLRITAGKLKKFLQDDPSSKNVTLNDYIEGIKCHLKIGKCKWDHCTGNHDVP